MQRLDAYHLSIFQFAQNNIYRSAVEYKDFLPCRKEIKVNVPQSYFTFKCQVTSTCVLPEEQEPAT